MRPPSPATTPAVAPLRSQARPAARNTPRRMTARSVEATSRLSVQPCCAAVRCGNEFAPTSFRPTPYAATRSASTLMVPSLPKTFTTSSLSPRIQSEPLIPPTSDRSAAPVTIASRRWSEPAPRPNPCLTSKVSRDHDWRGVCAAQSVTGMIVGSTALLGDFFILLKNFERSINMYPIPAATVTNRATIFI